MVGEHQGGAGGRRDNPPWDTILQDSTTGAVPRTCPNFRGVHVYDQPGDKMIASRSPPPRGTAGSRRAAKSHYPPLKACYPGITVLVLGETRRYPVGAG